MGTGKFMFPIVRIRPILMDLKCVPVTVKLLKNVNVLVMMEHVNVHLVVRQFPVFLLSRGTI